MLNRFFRSQIMVKVNTDDEYYVEKILDYRIVDDHEEYLVFWLYYTEEDVTWGILFFCIENFHFH